MATGLGQAIRDQAVGLRDLLNGQAGISTSLEPSQVQLPGAWVSFAQASAETMSGYALRFNVFLIVPAYESQLQVMDALAGLLAKALDVIEPEDDQPITATAVTLPTNPATPMPAYRVVVDVLAEPESE
jgi:hypothetical protein